MELRRRGSSERVALQDGMVLGRLAACDLQVDDGSVSRKHAQVEVRGGAVAVLDLGSSNGVFLNGQRTKRAELRVGDLLTLGSVPFDVIAPLETAPPARPAASPAAGSGAGPAASADEVFEVPVEGEAPARSAYAQAEAERARLRTAHGRERRSRGLGDLSQQPLWLRWLIYAAAVGLMVGVVQGVRLLAGGL